MVVMRGTKERNSGLWNRDDLEHFIQDGQAGFMGLFQCFAHDLRCDALDLDVHLQGGDAFGGSGNFEIHVAEVVFSSLDVGENDIIVHLL